MSAATDQIALAIQQCRPFISTQQISVMMSGLRGEEGDWFRAKFIELAKQFATMPKTYEQDGLGEAAIVHLHYFNGSADWYITERDATTAQHQAFGLADLFGDGGELGYISILELIRGRVDFDLHWTPRPLGEVMKKLEAA